MRIAIADRDLRVTRDLKQVVECMGHNATIFVSGTQLMTQLQRDMFDLLILGWQLSDRPGLHVLQWIGGNLSAAPLIIMTSDSAIKEDVAAALHGGADDHIMLPQDPDLLRARVAALLRRSGGRPPPADSEQRFGRYCFDRKKFSVMLDGGEVALTAKEFALALLFFQNAGRDLSRAYLLDMVWNCIAGLPSRTLDMHVSRVRAKLRLGPENGFELITIFGYGYRLERLEEKTELR